MGVNMSNMSERDFIVWLSGFISGVGSSPTETHWKLLTEQLNRVDMVDLSSGKSKQLLHDGTLNIIRDTKK
jgi:hypothetical protein